MRFHGVFLFHWLISIHFLLITCTPNRDATHPRKECDQDEAHISPLAGRWRLVFKQSKKNHQHNQQKHTNSIAVVIFLELGKRGEEYESLRMFFLMAFFGWF